MNTKIKEYRKTNSFLKKDLSKLWTSYEKNLTTIKSIVSNTLAEAYYPDLLKTYNEIKESKFSSTAIQRLLELNNSILLNQNKLIKTDITYIDQDGKTMKRSHIL